jgi:hypothetical protein
MTCWFTKLLIPFRWKWYIGCKCGKFCLFVQLIKCVCCLSMILTHRYNTELNFCLSCLFLS